MQSESSLHVGRQSLQKKGGRGGHLPISHLPYVRTAAIRQCTQSLGSYVLYLHVVRRLEICGVSSRVRGCQRAAGMRRGLRPRRSECGASRRQGRRNRRHRRFGRHRCNTPQLSVRTDGRFPTGCSSAIARGQYTFSPVSLWQTSPSRVHGANPTGVLRK